MQKETIFFFIHSFCTKTRRGNNTQQHKKKRMNEHGKKEEKRKEDDAHCDISSNANNREWRNVGE
jgi:hypothetical protein